MGIGTASLQPNLSIEAAWLGMKMGTLAADMLKEMGASRQDRARIMGSPQGNPDVHYGMLGSRKRQEVGSHAIVQLRRDDMRVFHYGSPPLSKLPLLARCTVSFSDRYVQASLTL